MKHDSKIDGGPAFPTASSHMQFPGLTVRDYFAIHGPQPPDGLIKLAAGLDKGRNPYNEPNKPEIRDHTDIVADLRYRFADAMLKAREKDPDKLL